MKTLTVAQLQAQLALLPKKCQHHEVAIMVVENGITYAEPVRMVIEGDPADGQIVWIITGERQNPMWMGDEHATL